MKNIFRLVGFFILVALTAVGSCWISHHYFWPPRSVNEKDFHAWIHEQLALTPEQDRLLEPSERKYAERKKHFTELIQLGNMELAQALLRDQSYTAEVQAAVEKIHHAHGELQKATLEHLFEMKEALTAEQYQRLLNLSANALYSNP